MQSNRDLKDLEAKINKLNTTIDRLDTFTTDINQINTKIDGFSLDLGSQILNLAEKQKKRFGVHYSDLFDQKLADNPKLVLNVVLGFQQYDFKIHYNNRRITSTKVLGIFIDNSNNISFDWSNMSSKMFLGLFNMPFSPTNTQGVRKQVNSSNIVFYKHSINDMNHLETVNYDSIIGTIQDSGLFHSQLYTFYLRDTNFSGILKFFVDQNSKVQCELLEPDEYVNMIK